MKKENLIYTSLESNTTVNSTHVSPFHLALLKHAFYRPCRICYRESFFPLPLMHA